MEEDFVVEEVLERVRSVGIEVFEWNGVVGDDDRVLGMRLKINEGINVDRFLMLVKWVEC